jgi:uncharacterized protein (DUF305 family)
MPNHQRPLVRFAGLSLFAVIALFNAVAMVRAQENQGVSNHGASLRAQPVDETPFLTENAAAMDKMMVGMNVKPTRDIDVDFTAMMIPHHQGAIDMAVAYLRYGKNEQLRRLAQEIIVDQQQEIAAMRLAVGQPLAPSTPAPTQPSASRSHGAQSMTSGHDH